MSTHWHIYYVNFRGRAKEIEKLFHFVKDLDPREFVHENDGFGETWLGKYLRKAGITDFDKNSCKGYIDQIHIKSANWLKIRVANRVFAGSAIWEEIVKALDFKSIFVYCSLPEENKKGGKNMNYPEEITITWNVEDVLHLKNHTGKTYEELGMTRQEAAHVLHEVEACHDANEGINWNILSIWADILYGDKYREL